MWWVDYKFYKNLFKQSDYQSDTKLVSINTSDCSGKGIIKSGSGVSY